MKVAIYKIFRSGKFYKSLMMYFLTFTCLSALLILFLTSHFVKETIITKHLENYLTYTHKSIETNVTEFVNNINLQSYYLTQNKNVYNILLNDKMSESEKSAELDEIFSTAYGESDDISYISIITNDQNVFNFSNEDDIVPSCTTDFIENDTSYGTYIYTTPKTDTNGNNYIVFGKKFKNYNTNYDMGYLLFYVKESKICSIYENSILTGGTSYITHKNFVISHPDKSQLGAKLYNAPEDTTSENLKESYNNKYIYTSGEIKNTPIPNLKMHNVISIDSLHVFVKKLNMDIILISFLNIIISMLIALFLSRRLGNSITTLKSRMADYGNGKDVDFSAFKNDEIKALEDSFEKLVTEIDILIEKNNEEKRRQKVAELAALQAQINPHFIYNTLDTISWLAKIKKQPQIEKIVMAFASFFRISLHKGDNIITIEEEIEHIKSYITIEQIRFPDLFNIIFDISPEILHLKTIKIILQPLVENSIKHGFFKLYHPFELTIKV
ncbi:MAG: histidine kinase [Oscillospiraceae bacterium]